MQQLTKEQRDKVLAMWREGMRTSRIATLLGLTREYVRDYVKYLNAHPEFK